MRVWVAATRRRRTVTYWVTTGIVVAESLIGGVADLLRLDPFFSQLVRLGYPAYLATILGIAKLLAAVVLTAPRLPRLKEWAYAGIMINMLGAAASQVAARNGPGDWLPPLVFAVLAMTSWALRPPSRRLGGDTPARPAEAPAASAAGLPAPATGARPPVGLILRNLAFSLVVPGLGGVYLPWRILSSNGTTTPRAWIGLVPITAGAALYTWSVRMFARVGGGTPGPWDAPRRVVAAGPYRWVRNPIYIAALLIVLGEAWLFLASALIAYAVVMAVFFHAFVTLYEEPTLRRHFGQTYQEYRAAVPRWIPRPPRPHPASPAT